MIVADASLIACLALRNEQSALADAVCEADAVWVAPLVWRSEFRQVLAQYVQDGRLSLEAALLMLAAAEEAVGGREYRVSSEAVLELAARSNCAAFACEYAALAGDLGVPLVTLDRQLVRAFPKVAVSALEFTKEK